MKDMTKLFIATDLEPDDFLAIVLVIEHYIKNNISFDNLLICTSLMICKQKEIDCEKIIRKL